MLFCFSGNKMLSLVVILQVFLLIGLFQGSMGECIHHKLDINPTLIEESTISSHRRLSTGYAGIRIYPDYTFLNNVTNKMYDYITKELVPPTLNYFQSTLMVPPVEGAITIPYSYVCELPTPKIYFNQGVEADLIIFIRATNTQENYIAAARACSLLSPSNRPVIGELFFNIRAINITDQAEFQSHIVTTLHEMTHILAFSPGLYERYINPTTGKTLTGHIKRKIYNGMLVHIIDVKPLTDRLKKHFSCGSIEGGYLEDQGGSGSQGAHWERKIFHNEYMTSSDILDSRVTELTLALLEGSGWYQVNYNMSEPFLWGKGKGCDFINKDCINRQTKTATFEEFCSPLTSRGCTFTGRAQGYCGATKIYTDPNLNSEIDYWGNKTITFDVFADNCPYVMDYINADCENPSHSYVAKLSAEKFGDSSKCFTGNFLNGKTASSKLSYCLKYKCEMNYPGDYSLKIEINDATVTCKAPGKADVPGYQGQLDCPDPNVYCQTVGANYCRRGCMGNGVCNSNKVCVCNNGWEGNDCSLRNGNLIPDPDENGGKGNEHPKDNGVSLFPAFLGMAIVLGIFYVMKRRYVTQAQSHAGSDADVELRPYHRA